MQDTNLPGDRRDFLARAASTAAVGLGAMFPVGTATAAASEISPDIADWLNSITGKHRQVTDWPDFNNGMGLIYTSNFLTTGAIGYGVSQSELGAVLVIRHDTIPIAFKDPVWEKYKLGAMFRINDPDTNAPAVRNAYYLKPGALPFPEAALSKLVERGVKVVACNLAITFWSGVVAQQMGLKHEDVKKEWTDAVYPGIKVLPSGLFACNAAQSRGCQYLFAG